MDALELIVDQGRPANAGRFFALGNDLLTLLDELSDVPVAWRVSELSTGSAIVALSPPLDRPREARVLRLAIASLAAVNSGSGLSDEWSPDAINVAHRFVEHAQPADGEEGWVPPRLVLVTDTAELAPTVALTADLGKRLADLQPFERRMPGSVRGELVGLNVSRGNRASIRLPNRRIVRVGFESALREELKAALYQKVELTGLVRQDGEGRVFHVKAQGVEVLVRPPMRWTDLVGIDPDYLEGKPVGEWLEEHRGQA